MITYPLNNIDYTAEDAELYFSTRESGVYDGNDFEVTASGIDNDVIVSSGIAWIHNTKFSGKVVALKEPKTLTLSLPNSVYDRIDAIVIQFDANNNATDIIVKEGIASSSPVAPAVVRTESLYELHIFHVQRKAGATVISVDNLVDLRNDSNYCGIMFDPISSIDATLTKSGYAADAAVVGLFRQTGLSYRGHLTSKDDVNDQTDNGIYTYSTNDRPANAPYENAAVILVFGGTSNASQKIQIGVRYDMAGKMSFRALYNTWQKWVEVVVSTDVIPVKQGGTGASSRKDAFNALAYLGTNPITTTTDDTPVKWTTMGSGFAWFNAKSQLVDQPAQWGIVLNLTYTGEVFQIWNSQSGGPTYFRSGNSSGWSGTWRKALDSTNTEDYITAQGTSGIWTYRKWNSGVAECWGKTANKTVDSTTAWGGLYYGDYICDQVSFPFTFTARPTISATPVGSSADFWLCASNSYPGNTSSTPKYYPMTAASKSSLTAGVDFYVVGKWK